MNYRELGWFYIGVCFGMVLTLLNKAIVKSEPPEPTDYFDYHPSERDERTEKR